MKNSAKPSAMKELWSTHERVLSPLNIFKNSSSSLKYDFIALKIPCRYMGLFSSANAKACSGGNLYFLLLGSYSMYPLATWFANHSLTNLSMVPVLSASSLTETGLFACAIALYKPSLSPIITSMAVELPAISPIALFMNCWILFWSIAFWACWLISRAYHGNII